MTFNAGEIESTLTLDRSPFSRELKEARREGEAFVKNKLRVEIEARFNPAKVRREIEAFIIEQSRKVIRLKVELDVTRARASMRALRTEADALRDSLNDVDTVLNGGGGGASGASAAADDLHLLLDSAVALGPALVPLTSGLSGLASGIVGVGLDTALAVKGIQKAMEEGTDVGVQYASGVQSVKDGVEALQRTAAAGTLEGFDKGVDEFTKKLPEINAFVSRTAPLTGDILANGAETILNLFTAAEPLIEDAEREIAGMMQDLSDWSGTSEASDFFESLRSDIPIAVEAIGNIATVLADVVTAAAPVGHVILEAVNGVTGFLNVLGDVPGLLTAIVTGLVAWRVAALATAAANKILGVASTGAAASGAAGAATGIAARAAAGSRLAGGAMMLGKALPVVLVGSLVANAADTAVNDDTRKKGVYQGNDAVLGAKAFTSFFGDLFSGDFSFSGTRALKDAQMRGDMLNEENANLRKWRGSNLGYEVSDGAKFAQRRKADDAMLSQRMGEQTDPTKVAQSNNDITGSIQKRIDAEKKLFDTSKGAIEVTRDLKVSADEYYKVLNANGGNEQATINYFRGHKEAMDADQQTLSQLVEKQGRYNDFLSVAQGKYRLTTQEVSTYAAALGLSYDKITASTQNSELAAQALDAVANQFRNGDEALQGWAASISGVDLDTKNLTDKVDLLGAALTALQGTTNIMAGANLNAVSSAEAAASAIDKNRKSVGKNGELLGQLVKQGDRWIVRQPKLTAGSSEIQQAMAGAATSAVDLARSIYQNTGSADSAFRAYQGLRAQFYDTALQMTGNKTAAKNLTNQIYGIPKDAKTFVKLLGKNDVAGAIRSLTAQLITLNGTLAKPTAGLTDNASSPLNTILGKLDAFDGTFTAHLKTVSDGPAAIDPKNPKKGVGGGTVITGGSHGLIAYSYAVGGVNAPKYRHEPGDRANQHQPLVSPASAPGMVRVFAEPETQGEIFAPLANDGRRPRAKSVIEYAVNHFGGEVEWYANGGGSLPSLNVGGDSGGGGGKGKGKSGGKSKKKELSKADKKANSVLDQFITSIGTEIGSLAGAADQTVQSLTKNLAKINQTVADLRKKSVTDGRTVRDLRRDNRELLDLVKRRQTILKNLDNARQRRDQAISDYRNERDTVTEAGKNTFNIATDGNGYGYGILATLTQKRSDLQKFERLRGQAKKLGLNAELLKEITENPATAGANLEAIVKGGKGYVGKLNAQYSPLAAAASRLGKTQAEDTYRKSITNATNDVRKYTAQAANNSKSIARGVKEIRDELRELRKDAKAKKRTK